MTQRRSRTSTEARMIRKAIRELDEKLAVLKGARFPQTLASGGGVREVRTERRSRSRQLDS